MNKIWQAEIHAADGDGRITTLDQGKGRFLFRDMMLNLYFYRVMGMCCIFRSAWDIDANEKEATSRQES